MPTYPREVGTMLMKIRQNIYNVFRYLKGAFKQQWMNKIETNACVRIFAYLGDQFMAS